MIDLWRLRFTLKQRLLKIQYWLKPAHQPPYLSSFNDFQFRIDVCYVGMYSFFMHSGSWGRRCEPGQGSDNYFVQKKPDTAGHSITLPEERLPLNSNQDTFIRTQPTLIPIHALPLNHVGSELFSLLTCNLYKT